MLDKIVGLTVILFFSALYIYAWNWVIRTLIWNQYPDTIQIRSLRTGDLISGLIGSYYLLDISSDIILFYSYQGKIFIGLGFLLVFYILVLAASFIFITIWKALFRRFEAVNFNRDQFIFGMESTILYLCGLVLLSMVGFRMLMPILVEMVPYPERPF